MPRSPRQAGLCLRCEIDRQPAAAALNTATYQAARDIFWMYTGRGIFRTLGASADRLPSSTKTGSQAL